MRRTVWFRDFAAALGLLREEADSATAWRLGATVLLVVTGGLLAGLAPLALKSLVDTLASGEDWRRRTVIASATAQAAWYLAALCVARLLAELRPSLIGAAEQRIYARLRQRFLAHLLALGLPFHLSRRTGALVQSGEQALLGYQIIIFNLVHSLLPVLVELVTVTLVLLSLGQPAMVATFGATALAYLGVVSMCARRLEGVAHAVSDASLRTQGMLTDALLNYETIKYFGAERSTRDRFDATSEALERRWVRLHRERTRLGLALTMTFVLSVTASLALSIHAVAHGSLSIGGFVLANVYMLQIVRPFEMLGAAARDLSQALVFVRPMLDVLAQAPESSALSRLLPAPHCDDGPSGAAIDIARPQRGPCISFRAVRFGYDGQTLVHDLDLSIPAGRTVAIVGASGSGKSSLIRLLLRLYEPQAGGIWLDDQNIASIPLSELRALIGLVPQDAVLFNDTMAFNIAIGNPAASRCDIERAAQVARLHDFIVSLPAGYDTVVGERGLRLSGGERQRIAIARAVVRQPCIYVLDEATSMLDNVTESKVLTNLQSVSAGCTTITIAHRLSTVRHADEIVVLEGGRVAERGDHASLLARNGPYALMWAAQGGAVQTCPVVYDATWQATRTTRHPQRGRIRAAHRRRA